jgi:dUTP pyrophosphatase
LEQADAAITRPAAEVVIGYRLFREGAFAPEQGTGHAAGFDVRAWVMTDVHGGPRGTLIETITTVEPGGMEIINTGLNLRIPEGWEVQVRPRSGLAAKHQVTVMNAPGTIDADYDGDGVAFEVKIMLKNTGPSPFVVAHGMRVAQLVAQRAPRVEFRECFGENESRLSSNRVGGLGSTGTK